jgi:hypothetical protein
VSFDVIFSAFRNGEFAPFPLTVLERVWGRFVERREPKCWILKFPDGGWSDLYLDPTDEISDFGINRPAGSPELWQGLFDILRETSGVAYWGSGAVVADEGVIAHLPAGMAEIISPITVVTEPKAIQAAIRKS